MSGFVFRGDRGWLTVVPYGNPGSIVLLDGLDGDLAPFLGAPVIRCACHVDFGWSFSLTLPDGRATAFQCWSSKSASDGSFLDEAILAEAVPPERVRPFLGRPLPSRGNVVSRYGTCKFSHAGSLAQAVADAAARPCVEPSVRPGAPSVPTPFGGRGAQGRSRPTGSNRAERMTRPICKWLLRSGSSRQPAQAPVPALGDAEQARLAARGPLLRRPPEPGGEVPPAGKRLTAADLGHQGRRVHHADAGDCRQAPGGPVFGARPCPDTLQMFLPRSMPRTAICMGQRLFPPVAQPA